MENERKITGTWRNMFFQIEYVWIFLGWWTGPSPTPRQDGDAVDWSVSVEYILEALGRWPSHIERVHLSWWLYSLEPSWQSAKEEMEMVSLSLSLSCWFHLHNWYSFDLTARNRRWPPASTSEIRKVTSGKAASSIDGWGFGSPESSWTGFYLANLGWISTAFEKTLVSGVHLRNGTCPIRWHLDLAQKLWKLRQRLQKSIEKHIWQSSEKNAPLGSGYVPPSSQQIKGSVWELQLYISL